MGARIRSGVPGQRRVIRIDAAAAADYRGVLCEPASALVEIEDHEVVPEIQRGGEVAPSAARERNLVPAGRGRVRLLALGAPGDADRHEAAPRAERLDRQASLLIPGLVNAHTHLDLTAIGAVEFDPVGGFGAWADRVRRERPTEPDAIAAAVRLGAALSLAGGVVAVGDIAGAAGGRANPSAAAAIARTPLTGVSFIEFFAIGSGEGRSLAALREVLGGLEPTERLRFGLQPHAPYSVSLPAYIEAVTLASARGLSLATHLAETPGEREFVASGTGPQRALLERVGVWEHRLARAFSAGAHPIDHLRPALVAARDAGRPFVCAHVNDLPTPAHAVLLAEAGASVAYSPRASEYFAAQEHFGPHPYRDLLHAGVNVCLGTDSVLNLPPAACDPVAGGITVWHEACRLFRRDATDPATLLAMATRNGAISLQIDPSLFELRPGSDLAGIVAVPASRDGPGRSALERALRAGGPPELIVIGA